MKAQSASRIRTLDLTFIAISAVLIALCSWITIPATVPFTMQTFGVLTVLGLLGGKRGTIAIFIYILLGLIGLPVFSGFGSGAGVLFGTTGGYILGFLFCGLLYWLITALFQNSKFKKLASLIGMILGMVVCYTFGTAWFMVVYAKSNDAVSLITALGWCVFPFLIPDGIKLALAYILSRATKKYLPI